EGDGELDHAEVGAEVAARDRDVGDEKRPDLGRQAVEIVGGELPELRRFGDALEQHGDLGCGIGFQPWRFNASRTRVSAWDMASPPAVMAATAESAGSPAAMSEAVAAKWRAMASRSSSSVRTKPPKVAVAPWALTER